MFTTVEITEMRNTQIDYMMDECKREVYSASEDSYNDTNKTWTVEATGRVCGLEMKSGNEIDKTTMTLVQYDAILRLPVNTNIDVKDKVLITKRHGENVTNIEYMVVSPPQRGVSAVRVLLKKVSA